MNCPECLAPEAIFAHLSSRILTADLATMLMLAPELGRKIPELASLVGFNQHSPHHAYDIYTHVAHVVAGVPQDLTLRWAALLHDVGKVPAFTRDETGRGHFYGHAPLGAELADRILLKLQAPDGVRHRVVWLIANHMTRLPLEEKGLMRQQELMGREALDQLICLQEADMGGKGTGDPAELDQFTKIREILSRIREE